LRTGCDQRRKFHHPTVQRRVVDHHPVLGQNILKVAIGNGVTQVEKHSV
jgi:hypothetical protein